MGVISKRSEVWVFIALIIGANAVFVGAIASGVLPRSFYASGRFALLALLLFSVVFALRRWSGIAHLLRPLLKFNVPIKWYVLAICWAPLHCMVLLLFKFLFSNAGSAELALSFSVIARPSILKVIIISSLIGEIVWISYAVRQLSERTTYYISGCIVGFFWTLWWMPMVFYNIGIVPDLPVLGLLFLQTGVALMCAFLYAHTHSAVVILMMQVSFNSSILAFPVMPTTGGVGTYWMFAILYFSSATLMFAVFGPRPLLGTVARKLSSSSVRTQGE